MAKSSEALEGLTRIADAAEEKFRELLEISGKTEEEVLARQEEKEAKDSDTQPEDGGETQGGDENTIPTPENMEGGEGIPQNGMDMAAAQAGVEGGAAPAMEIPPDAQQMLGAEGGQPPPDMGGEAPVGAGEPPPDEEELMRQLQQQQGAAPQQ